ncbi:MAG: glycerophosphodiester phosphodiesterase family protein [Acidimicrobiaceae bacterium]|nr:glycerophosphodiester phosphodiesterase family protein [Acidimicrobiaceae bacterium]
MSGLHPFLQHRGPIAFAHRGGTSVYPENSERAFRHAVDLGFSYIETDVQATRDGVAVIMHDNRLDRTTDSAGDIAELSWVEISRARINGTEPILRVSELLEAFPTTFVNFDPKRDEAVEPLARAILEADSLDRVLIGAFSDRRIDQARALLGDGLAVGAGSRRVMALMLRANRIPVPLERVDAAQVPVRMGRIEIVTQRFVRHARETGIHVHVWGVDDPTEMHRLLDLGVDGLMTDEPEVLRSVFEERGVWNA